MIPSLLAVAPRHHQTLILGVDMSSLGALVAGVGALLLLGDAIGRPEQTFGGTLGLPKGRLSSGMELAGSLYVVVGTALLIIASSNLTVAAVLIVVALAGALVYGRMTARLYAHHRLVRTVSATKPRSLAWCLAHPRWRPESETRPSPPP